jgi:putative hydrolases of HD superfamily
MAVIAAMPPTSLAPSLDIGKCIKMSLFHDIAESLVGDLTPADGVSKAEKSRREELAMSYFRDKLLCNVNDGAYGKELLELWQEFERGESLESCFVQDVDKIEMLLQKVEYEDATNKELDEFTYAATKIKLPEMRTWAQQLLSGRKVIRAEDDTRMTRLQDEYYGKS